MKKIQPVSIDKETLEKGKQQAKKEHRSFSSLIEYLLSNYLNKK